jgi:uncharacterized DUF497 family protein
MFEFDPEKSAANKAKHGINFEEAQEIWDDDQRIIGPTYSGGDDERFMVIGLMDGKLWAAAITMRDELVRIVSVRRVRANEAKAYGDEQNQR